MLQSRRSALLLLHFTVFIWGWTGILGVLIHLPAAQLVYLRTVIGLLGMLVVALWTRTDLSLHGPDVGQYLLTSVLITAHWITFYYAIKVSTASIAAGCLSTSTVFTALLEPFWFKRKIRSYEVALGVVVVAALLLVFGLETKFRWGIAVSVLSALLSAWFNVVNGVLVRRGDAMRIGFYEMLGSAATVGTYLWVMGDLPVALWALPLSDALWMLVLGLVCTTFAFVAGIAVMKQLSPFTVVLAVNLEPVYTMIIAVILWPMTERLQTGSYLGFALILACLFLNGWRQRRLTAQQTTEPDPLAQG